MTCRVIISRNPFEPDDYVIHDDVENPCALIAKEFTEFPETARIYHNHVSQLTDVTPKDEADVDKLEKMDGDIYVIVYPAGFALMLLLLVVALVAAVVLLKPKVPTVDRNSLESSPNNELAARTNRARLQQRIPDIYGQVRSVPDMLCKPYTVFSNNRELEVGYFCVGAGYYQVEDIRDGESLMSNLAGSSAVVYAPFTSPNYGTPQAIIGTTISDPLLDVYRVNEVIGQPPRAPNRDSVIGNNDIRFEYPDTIRTNDPTRNTFDENFATGDTLTISDSGYGALTGPNQARTGLTVRLNSSGRVEYIVGDPRLEFMAGDSITLNNFGAMEPVLKPYYVNRSASLSFRLSTRRFTLASGNLSEFRSGDNIVLAGANLSYNFNGNYVVSSVDLKTLTLTSPASVNSGWNQIPTTTGTLTGMTISKGGTTLKSGEGMSFTSSGTIVLNTSDWEDLAPGDTITVAGAVKNYNLNGTYTVDVVSGTYLSVVSPNGVNSGWDELPSAGSGYANVTLQTYRVGDTRAVNFNGTYNIDSVGSTYVQLTSPGSVNDSWNHWDDYVNPHTNTVSNGSITLQAPTRNLNFNGTYTIVAVTSSTIVLSNPAAVNSAWAHLDEVTNERTAYGSADLVSSNSRGVGPFFISDTNTTGLYLNMVAEGGLYYTYSSKQYSAALTVEFRVRWQPTDANGNNVGAYTEWDFSIVGSAKLKTQIGHTFKCSFPASAGKVTLFRLTPTQLTGTNIYQDNVKWRDLYAVAPVPQQHFGNVTTIHTQTYATGGNLAVKERKLNCLVTRKIPYITGWTGPAAPNRTPVYSPDLIATRDAAQIFCALSRDTYFGNRPEEEIDFYGIFTAASQVSSYFGTTKAREFCHTFDNTSISYEEAAQAIANAAFCTAYRQGSKIKWRPEIATQEPVMIFNHRNKIPGTETRTVRFSSENDHDSIQLEWVNPADDSVETFFIPEDQSGSAPKRIETIGIRNITQATWHAWRAYQKMKYQNHAVEFETTQEAALLVSRDRVLVADNTRADVQDGEIWDQEVLQLFLSQDVSFKSGVSYTMFIQHTDGSTEAIPVTSVPDNLALVKNVYIGKLGYIRFPVVADAGLLAPGDTVVLTVTSITDPVNGILNLNGTYTVSLTDNTTGIVMLDNPGEVNINWTKITPNELGPRTGMNINSTRVARRRVNLQYAPRAPLSLDPESYARATYIIRGNNETSPQTFMVMETRPRDNFKYQVSLANYDPRFYYIDDLKFWLNFNDGTFRDASASGLPVVISTAANKATISWDSQRQSNTFDNAANASVAWVQCPTLTGGGSYTKAFWIKQQGGFDSYFLSSDYEHFRVNMNNRIIVGHQDNLTRISSVTWPSGNTWNHACATYDASTQILRAYVNGMLVAQAVDVPAPTAGVLQPIGYNGSGVAYRRADDVRYWKRAFNEQQVYELYQSTR